MCYPCTKAGSIGQASRDRTIKKKMRRQMYDGAIKLHDKCADPVTCTCQHRMKEFNA